MLLRKFGIVLNNSLRSNLKRPKFQVPIALRGTATPDLKDRQQWSVHAEISRPLVDDLKG
ncbi:hypothetical protein FP2506_18019 [Fulvimarina pelagi HTCC2506]|uniref:Uncharacterized protein n=1 Tax=Fulvimarina pelagi HTCC2506 TaxID=314231 RepID=Q0G129_9HYPH|nr:hypothetical protein FP2506_18019 [Fulvimarina pelagi HTCC2506]